MKQTSFIFNPLVIVVLTTLLLSLIDSSMCLSCWHCIAENCAEDPADNSRASKKECSDGQTCQKVYFEMFSKLDDKRYESTVRGCSSNCVQRDDFPTNCSILLRESRGCIKKTCCHDYDLCNTATSTSSLTEFIIFYLCALFYAVCKM